MAGTASFVRVAVDGVGKRILNLLHAGFLAGDDAYQQLVGLADPTDPSLVAGLAVGLPGDAAVGQVTREAPDNYDSGIVTLPNSYNEIIATTVRVSGLWLCNLTGVVQPVSVKNHAGNVYVNAYPLQGNMSIFLNFGRVKMVGIQWLATNAASVNGQIWGRN